MNQNKDFVSRDFIANKLDDNIEIEVSFTDSFYDKKYFLSLAGYNNLIEWSNNYPYQETTDIVEIYTNVNNNPKTNLRVITNNDKTKVELKTNLNSKTDSNYGVKTKISKEETTSIDYRNLKSTLVRQRQRRSVNLNDNFRVDITRVNNNQYECELEFVSKDINFLADFNKQIWDMIKVIQDTNIIYTLGEKKDVNDKIKQILDMKPNENFSFSQKMSQPRNLHLKDIVDGGLVNHFGMVKYLDKKEKRKVNYSVTHKVDGVRKLLLFQDNNIWLIIPDRSFNLFSKNAKNKLQMDGTILDGEYLNNQNEHQFYVFDLIHVGKNIKNYELKPAHMDRIREAGNLIKANLIKSDVSQENKGKSMIGNIHFIMKNFRQFELKKVDNQFIKVDPVKMFYQVMNQMFDERENLTFPTDGFIFTPSHYNIDVQKLPLSMRKLNKYADHCKWKPEQDITIDFKVQIVNDKVKLLTSEDVDFKGTLINPYNNNLSVDQYKKYDGQIVEFRFNKQTQDLEFIKTRVDKPSANKLDISQDNWNLIFNPVKEETLRGTNYDLYRQNHKNIKRSLYYEIKEVGNTILEIGSGKGGDLFNINNSKIDGYPIFTNYIGVEPNQEYIGNPNGSDKDTFYYKAKSLNMDLSKIQVFNTDFQNFDFIKSIDKVGVISAMFSLTYIMKDTKSITKLARLIKTKLKDGGYFIFIVIDKTLIELEKENLTPDQKLDFIEFNQDGSHKFNIEDSETAKNIDNEYPVDIYDLINQYYKIYQQRLIIEKLETTNKEIFLNDNETKLNKLYSYGIIRKPGFLANDFDYDSREYSGNYLSMTKNDKFPEEVKNKWTNQQIFRHGTVKNSDYSLYDALLTSLLTEYRNQVKLVNSNKIQTIKEFKAELESKISENNENTTIFDLISSLFNIDLYLFAIREYDLALDEKYIKDDNRSSIMIGYVIDKEQKIYESLCIRDKDSFSYIYDNESQLVKDMITI